MQMFDLILKGNFRRWHLQFVGQDLHFCHAFWRMMYTLAQSFPEKHQAHSKLSWAYPGGKHNKNIQKPGSQHCWKLIWITSQSTILDDWMRLADSLDIIRSCCITWGLVVPFASPFSMAQTLNKTLNNTVALLPIERWKKEEGIMWNTIFSPLLQSSKCHLNFLAMLLNGVKSKNQHGFRWSWGCKQQQGPSQVWTTVSWQIVWDCHNHYLWCSQSSTTRPPDLGSTKPGNALSTPKGSALVASSANTPTVKLSSLANLYDVHHVHQLPCNFIVGTWSIMSVEGLYMMAENACSPTGAGFYTCWCCWWGGRCRCM